MVLGGKNDHAQTGSRILLFGVGNSGDGVGNGNRDFDRKKMVLLQLPGEKICF